MYEKHFGLKQRPFRSNANGLDVFVGPNIAATMAGIKKALTGTDAIVTVAGPVGSGKTTLVNRALESIGGNRITVCVARMHLDSNDVLEMLLDELGVPEKPNGTIQKFALFRHKLKQLADNDTRVYIVIEDTVRLGADTLAEIEALTAADAGESDGASIVLMGDDALERMLRETPLARLQQRIRQRLTIAALPVAEIRGYLRHCFRLAGRDFEQIFESNAAELLHYLSNGIPRISNNLVESAMTAAKDQNLTQVATTLLARVAENEYGLSTAGFDLAQSPEPVAEPEITELAVAELVEEADQIPQATPEAEQEPSPIPALVAETPVLVFADPYEDTRQEPQLEAEIPEMIQDTLPDLEILAPELAAVAQEPAPDPEPIPVAEPVVESRGDDVPAWERDPTIAELKPDLAALEQAMAFAQGDEPDPVAEDSEPLPKPQPEQPEVIPEITLDHAISQRIENNLIDEPGEISAPAEKTTPESANDAAVPAPNMPAKQNKKADVEIEKIAAELAKAKSIEDVDDKLAETLFGDEINFVAAQFLANQASADPADDAIEIVAATGEEEEVTLEAPKKPDDGGIDLSASQRLKTVRALNADPNPSMSAPEVLPKLTPAPAPESIEDQINTSMTKTLKALNVRPPVIDNDDDEENSGGFFNRFKRS